MGECPPHRLGQVGLVDAELPYRPPHAHLGTHELRGRVYPQAHPDPTPLPLRYGGEPVDLVQRLDVDREDALLDRSTQFIVGLGGPGEDDVLRLESRGPRHHELTGRGNLGAGLPLGGYELAHGEVGVSFEGEGDLRPDSLADAADPLHDHLPVVEVEGRAVLFRYPADGHPAGNELPTPLSAEAL